MDRTSNKKSETLNFSPTDINYKHPELKQVKKKKPLHLECERRVDWIKKKGHYTTFPRLPHSRASGGGGKKPDENRGNASADFGARKNCIPTKPLHPSAFARMEIQREKGTKETEGALDEWGGGGIESCQ